MYQCVASHFKCEWRSHKVYSELSYSTTLTQDVFVEFVWHELFVGGILRGMEDLASGLFGRFVRAHV